MIIRKELVSIAIALQELTQRLQSTTNTPRLDAEVLIAHALTKPRSFLYTYPEQALDDEIQAYLTELVKRRLQGEPVAYIIGEKEFWSLSLNVTPDTLIPRPETEHMIEWALHNLPENALIADLGTGSGSIALALAYERPNWRIHATDQSIAALKVAVSNARKHQLHNIEFYFGAWCDALPQKNYTAIISNPPYIAEDDPHLDNLSYEPMMALCAHDQGFAAFKHIINDASHYLLPGGKLVLEHGYNQAPMLMCLLEENGFQYVESHCDLAKQTRFIVGHHP